MFARKCDRCGKLYENYIDEGGNALYVFNRDDNGEALEKQVYVKDLCPDCMEKYRQFMDGYEPVPVNRAREMRSPVVLDGDKIIQAMESGDMPCDAPESSYSRD